MLDLFAYKLKLKTLHVYLANTYIKPSVSSKTLAVKLTVAANYLYIMITI